MLLFFSNSWWSAVVDNSGFLVDSILFYHYSGVLSTSVCGQEELELSHCRVYCFLLYAALLLFYPMLPQCSVKFQIYRCKKFLSVRQAYTHLNWPKYFFNKFCTSKKKNPNSLLVPCILNSTAPRSLSTVKTAWSNSYVEVKLNQLNVEHEALTQINLLPQADLHTTAITLLRIKNTICQQGKYCRNLKAFISLACQILHMHLS